MDWTENVKDESSKLADSLARERERLYVSTDGKRTFDRDEDLPSLLVPDLERTLERYLDSVLPHTTPEEFENTKRICQRFAKGQGAHLQNLLLERAKEERNWLDTWWRDVAYLRSRVPLIPQCNMAGTFGLFEFARRYPGPRWEYAAKGLFHYMGFWHLIRTEKLKQQNFRNIPWSMEQFRRAFNTVRVPQQEMDDLRVYFRTEAEQFDTPTNVIVLCRGHIFSIEMCDSQKIPLTAAEIAIGLEKIEKYCSTQPRGKGVGALTCQEREQWAADRQHLIDLSKGNEEKLKYGVIEESLMVCVLDETSPVTRSEIMTESLAGRCADRWADKGLEIIFFANLNVGTNSDHTPVDGMVPICLAHWAHLSTLIDDLNRQPMGPVRPANLKEPVYIDFQLDDELEMSLVRARTEYEKAAAKVDVNVQEFKGYGKDFLKTSQIHPEAFIQIALQAAYILLHGKPAPTYCTASTRGFYRGRTETCRSCSQEVVSFSNALIAKKSVAELGLLLSKAVAKFNLTMFECIHAKGCDRHLMGLAILAWLESNGEDMPEIFTDPSFERSGGNGKFVLSTSLNGFTPLVGGVVPMVEHGYGCFYSFEKDQIIINLIAYKDRGTCTKKFYQALVDTFENMKPLLTQSRL
ncbi:peroxisomal carnitine O-octanoyltransferase-like isoform X1 [Varroa jacobsoni]|uniref:peroxisomal carnitine O-octanoyltransferase-like isoform X1 n=1 Tax=Varroa jacobsoni TaxID=62625 RepID=UPI000BF73D32|nr:peroxisomal carnitine O-octanoyltransferase-like isoform X1 [Varroa jacobsoni]